MKLSRYVNFNVLWPGVQGWTQMNIFGDVQLPNLKFSEFLAKTKLKTSKKKLLKKAGVPVQLVNWI